MTNINVGDKVIVVNAEDSQYPKGTVLTVLEDDQSPLPYYCKHENGTREWMAANEVELESSATNQLADRVTALESELAELKASLAPKVPVFGDLHDVWLTPSGHLEGQVQSGKRAPQTANELRKAAIKLAQESVAESFENDNADGKSVRARGGHHRVEFVVDKENRTVVALLRWTYMRSKAVQYRGIAKCDPTDVFNVDIGKAIALDRAMARVTAVEILRAPNPTDIVVGMLVEPKPSSIYGGGPYIAQKIESVMVYDSPGNGWARASSLNILEDTAARY